MQQRAKMLLDNAIEQYERFRHQIVGTHAGCSAMKLEVFCALHKLQVSNNHSELKYEVCQVGNHLCHEQFELMPVIT